MEELLREAIGFRLGAAYRRVDRLYNRTFSKLGLSHAHGHIMACLLAAREDSVRGLAQRTGFEPSTVSRLVKELSRRKLIRRRKDPEDARSLLVRPASRGLALEPEIEKAVRLAEGRLRRDLAESDFLGLLAAADVLDRLP